MEHRNFHGYTIYADGTILGLYGKEVKKRINAGRYEVRLNVDKERKNFIVARLIYHVFHTAADGNQAFDIHDRNQCITHKDGDKLNIHLDNLVMQLRKDLIQGESHSAIAKLTDQQAQEIRSQYKGKAGSNQLNKKSPSMKDLADSYGVSKSNIAAIIRGESRTSADYKLK